jgi:hypothetical protein
MPFTLITDKKRRTVKRTVLNQNGKARQNKMLIKSHCTLLRDG